MNEWISVAEQLPKFYESVLLIAKVEPDYKGNNIKFFVGYIFDQSFRSGGIKPDLRWEIDCAYDCNSHGEPLAEVLYWMELPEKPEMK